MGRWRHKLSPRCRGPLWPSDRRPALESYCDVGRCGHANEDARDNRCNIDALTRLIRVTHTHTQREREREREREGVRERERD